MKLRNAIIISLLFLIFCIGAVSAANDVNTTSDYNINDANDNAIAMSDLSSTADTSLEVENKEITVEPDTNDCLQACDDGDKLGDAHTFKDLENRIKATKSGGTLYLNGEHFIGTGNEIIINQEITIDGKGPNGKAVLDADGKSQIFYICSDNVYLKNIIFKNGLERIGSAIFYGGHDGHGIDNCEFINNHAIIKTCSVEGFGGAVYIGGRNGLTTITNSIFRGNNGDTAGGAIYTAGQKTIINNCTFEENQCKDLGSYSGQKALGGGAIYKSYYTEIQITNSKFIKNTDNKQGGAIKIEAGTCGEIRNCQFIDNSASFQGGAVWWNQGRYGSISDCTFTNNTATRGGAVLYNGGEGKINNCTFINNHANEYGGALDWDGGEPGSVSNCKFINNSAVKSGGALTWNQGKNGEITNCQFTNNTASTAGAIEYNGNNGKVTNCRFEKNTAEDNKVISSKYDDFSLIKCNIKNFQ